MLTWTAPLILLGLIVFQMMAAAGTPVGKFTQGGKSKILSSSQRGFALISALLLMVALTVLAAQQGLVGLGPGLEKWIDRLCWFFAITFSLNVVMNALSTSQQERLTMTPLAVILAFAFWRSVLLS